MNLDLTLPSEPDSSPRQSQTTGRTPDATIAIGNARVSGWCGGDGWSFMASRSYRDASGQTKYSELALYPRDLLNVAACLQSMANHILVVRTQKREEGTTT